MMVKIVIDADAAPEQKQYYQQHMTQAVKRAQVIVLEWSQILLGLNTENGFVLMSQIAQAILDEGYQNMAEKITPTHIHTTYPKEVQ